MNRDIKKELKGIIVNSVGGNFDTEDIEDDYKLIGNLLDSMSITNLILGIEEHFDIAFDDDDLSEESFENIISLIDLVKNKMN